MTQAMAHIVRLATQKLKILNTNPPKEVII